MLLVRLYASNKQQMVTVQPKHKNQRQSQRQVLNHLPPSPQQFSTNNPIR